MSILDSDDIDDSVESRTAEIDRLEKYKTVVASGQSTLKALLTMNGGATIAFLTFVQRISEDKSHPAIMPVVFGALQYFIFGTFFAVLGYGFIFLTNCFSYVGYRRTSNVMFGVTIAACFVSIGCFLIASVRAVAAFAK
jgi:hypothetical protein